jgi:alpha-mannosidase
MREFGIRCETGYCVDSFGHNGNMPQLLAKGGMKNYVFMRPQPHENPDILVLFNWQSPDGSQVLTYRIVEHGYTALGKPVINDVLRLEKLFQDKGFDLMCFYGVGNHGGGPTKKHIDEIKDLIREGKALKFSSPDSYFYDIKKKNLNLPLYKGDLQYHAVGCYSVTSKLKTLQRAAERELGNAEIYMTMANILLGAEYNGNEIIKAYKNVLFNTFHDILCGCSIKRATDECIYSYKEALSIAIRNKERAILLIAKNINTMVKGVTGWGKSDLETWEENNLGVPVIIFNPYSYRRKAAVSINRKFGAVQDAKGNNIDFQYVQGEYLNKSETYLEASATLFEVDLPPVGYTTYWIYGKGQNINNDTVQNAKSISNDMVQTADGYILENSYLRIEFDEKSGAIVSIKNKNFNIEYLSKPSGNPFIVEDESDTWAHNLKGFYGNSFPMKLQSIKITENGPIRKTIQIKYVINNTSVLHNYSIYRHEDFIRVSVKINYNEKNSVLRYSFNSSLSDTKAYYEMPFGYIQKTCNEQEQPSLRWACIYGKNSGKEAGIAICCDSKSSYSLQENTLSFIGIRNSVYANHHAKPDKETEYDYTDEGISYFNYIILPVLGDIPFEKINMAADCILPPDYLIDSYHIGGLDKTFSLFDCDNAQIALTALKKRENGLGYVLRLNELAQKECSAKISFKNAQAVLNFKPNEIKTILFTEDKFIESDFLES